MRAAFTKLGGGMKSFGRNLSTFVTLPLLAAAGASIKFFGDFEQGLRGIEKTTGLARPEVAKLGMQFDQLSTEIPVTTQEMLALAQAGGQLGVKGTENISKFTVTMAKLGRASDVAGEEGAKSIARILTVTGDGIGKVERFSSALVDLGNNAAAGESEILAVATRVAGQIGRFDVASDKVLGISTALKALGKNAESSGSVIGRSFDAIDQSIKKGGTEVQILSKLTGIATKDLKKNFQDDAAGVFQKFVEGLGKVQSGGGNLVKVMGALGLEGVRINDILGTLSKNPKVLAENMDRASKAFTENTALEKEFQVQTESLNSALIIIKNTFVSLLTLIGAELAPAVKFFGMIIKGVLDFLRNNPTIRTLVIVFSAFAAVLGPVLFIFGAILIVLPSLIAGFAALGVTTLAALAPFLIWPLAIGAVIAAVVVLAKHWDSLMATIDNNPFLSILKTIFLLFTPLGQLVTMVNLVVSAFRGMDSFKNAVEDLVPGFLREKLFGPKGEKKGAREKNKGVGAGGTNKTEVGGNIGITLGGDVPSGSRASVSSSGPVGLDFGFAGGVQ
jgi:TP901 family phage tail tape measure protein